MKHLRIVIILLLLPVVALAEESEVIKPLLKMELSADQVMPGTPATLSISVMVPTWMVEPPAFPDLEVPQLMVRQPPDSVRSTRQRINRQMWVGVKREYLLYPMIPGEFNIPGRPLLVSYAHPETRAKVDVSIMTEPVRLFGAVPDEAKGLKPFIAAGGITLEQSVEGLSEIMRVGDALSREITANIEGTSPLFLPKLLPNWSAPGIASYPKEPVVVDESSGEGYIGGTRSESVSYAIEQGGRFELPAVELRWFNLSTGSIEITTLEPMVLVARLTLAQQLQRHWRSAAAFGLVALLLLWLSVRVFPRIATVFIERYRSAVERYRNSAQYAARLALKSMRQRDLDSALKHSQTWLERLPETSRPDAEELFQGLAAVGEARYGGKESRQTEDWGGVLDAMHKLRKRSHELGRQNSRKAVLPTLNPNP